MRKFYQKEWHGIPFSGLSVISSKKMADEGFYKSFYRFFFQKYHNFNELDPVWVGLKKQVASFLKVSIGSDRFSSVLSVGCGLGIIEIDLLENGYKNLEVTEVSEDSLIWLKQMIVPDKIHIGTFPGCLADNRRYDFIFLCGVEYFLDRKSFVHLLKSVKSRLKPGGKCIIVSWSFEPFNPARRIKAVLKDNIGFILEKTGIKHRGQFWGYVRSRKEFQGAMREAGFSKVNDGLFDKRTRWDTYWIEGKI